MITAQILKKRPTVFNRLVGILPKQFDKLFDIWLSFWNEFIREEFIERKNRKREYGGGSKPKLKEAEDKLLFILMYFRLYPTQLLQGFWFNQDESTANRWVHRLTPILKKALEFKGVLPKHTGGGRPPGQGKPRGRSLEEIIDEFPDLKDFLIDATEQGKRRSKNYQKQKEDYSGKKKKHTKKNIIVSDSRLGYVHFLGRTQPGSKHDKTMADEEELHAKSDVTIGGDLGFLGLNIGNAKIVLPRKKPKGEELTEIQKEQNRIFSQIRVKVEHAIGGVKRSKIASDIFRNTKTGFDDLSMFISCGLHNYRVRERYALKFCQA